jgi:hypothetical protein
MTVTAIRTPVLFGDHSIFGNREAFRDRLLKTLRTSYREKSQDPDYKHLRKVDGLFNSNELLSQCTKADLLNLAFQLDLTLDDIAPLSRTLSEDEADLIADDAKSRGLEVYAMDGELPPNHPVAVYFLQVTAIGQICKPVDTPTPEENRKFSELREKHKRFFVQSS